MKKTLFTILGISLALSFYSCGKSSSGGGGTTPEEKVDAFPGAEGGGRYTTGGRGGAVYYVDKLTDEEFTVGTLRYALVNRKGPRTIVFSVSGTIELKTPLKITDGNVTIAGQTAPGDGITLKNNPVSIEADNVIIRFIRFRLGDLKGSTLQDLGDCINGTDHKNIILDHCSMSWSIDETATFYANENFTMQWCIIAEGLRNSTHPKGLHGYGGIWGGVNASFHHNLLAHNDSRNPRFDGGFRTGTGTSIIGKDKVDFSNNVIYNWGGNSVYGGENGQYNMINNYYKSGPATQVSKKNRIMEISMELDNIATYAPGFGKFYITGNFVDGNTTVTADNWNGGVDKGSGLTTDNYNAAKQTTAYSATATTLHTAEKAYIRVLDYVGASLKRDAVDERIVRNVKDKSFDFAGSNGSNNGLIDSQEDVGGWPVLNSTTAPTDTDGDGIPDDWETAKGLNPNSFADGKTKTLNTKYTNLEVYLNSLVEAITTEQLKP